MVLYKVFTGAPLLGGVSGVAVASRHVHDEVPAPSHAAPGIPPALDELVLRATRRDPGARPVDAGAFLAELGHLRADLGLPSVPVRVPASNVGPTRDDSAEPTAAVPWRGGSVAPRGTAVLPVGGSSSGLAPSQSVRFRPAPPPSRPPQVPLGAAPPAGPPHPPPPPARPPHARPP